MHCRLTNCAATPLPPACGHPARMSSARGRFCRHLLVIANQESDRRQGVDEKLVLRFFVVVDATEHGLRLLELGVHAVEGHKQRLVGHVEVVGMLFCQVLPAPVDQLLEDALEVGQQLQSPRRIERCRQVCCDARGTQ